MDLLTALMQSERELTEGGGDVYRQRLIDDAVVVVPGQVLSKTQTVAAIDASPRWDHVEFADARLLEVTDAVAAVSYRFEGRRGDAPVYRALMSSVYVGKNGTWAPRAASANAHRRPLSGALPATTRSITRTDVTS